jgi:hypothetical protein
MYFWTPIALFNFYITIYQFIRRCQEFSSFLYYLKNCINVRFSKNEDFRKEEVRSYWVLTILHSCCSQSKREAKASPTLEVEILS